MATDIFRLLEKDHREVESLMKKIAEGNGDGGRKQLFEKFKTELTAHSKCEEREFYAVLQRHAELAETVEHAYEEHAEVEEGLQELSEMDEHDEEWMGKFSELRQDLQHHIKEEEGDLFPKSRKLIGEEAEDIGRRFQEAKEQWFETQGETSGDFEAESGRGGELERGHSGERESDRESARSETSPRGGGDVSTLTRDELYERARKLGIEGRSKMSKTELARAVRTRAS